MKPLVVYTPHQMSSAEPPDLSFAAYRFLAKGDSWFSLGTLNPARNSNLLCEMAFDQFACAVNCGHPGDTLARMCQMNTDPVFVQLLCGRRAFTWDGILVSCGGNDLIDALQGPDAMVPRAQRLLLRADEWRPAADGPARYLSPEGWQAFAGYLEANFEHLLGLRDAGPSAGCPVFVHGYACPTPRASGAGLGQGPWLQPALAAYGIPPEDWTGLAALLIRRLCGLMQAMAADPQRFPNLHFFDSSCIALDLAAADATGCSGDWENEIHLTRQGYEKLARPWAASIERTLRGTA